MPKLMRDSLFARMAMEHRDDAGVVVFTSQAWGRLFDTRGLLFQFSGARRCLSWRNFILALGLHTGEEMESPDFARFAAGRKSGAHISGGQFVGRLAHHFGLLTAEILRGLTLDDTWAWVAIGPERQPDATAGAPGVAQDAPIIDESGQVDPAPAQASPPPPTAAMTMP
ncbi:hypothetical protein Tco_1166254 [Tanacetum coccineum]